MVILSKKEHKDLMDRLDKLNLDMDILTDRMKEYDRRLALLEQSPKKTRATPQAYDEWINGKEAKP